jgi:hypothetical protein
MKLLKLIVRKSIALLHLSDKIVCEESANMGHYDFHDYPDDEEGYPFHMTLLKCRRCRKRFFI